MKIVIAYNTFHYVYLFRINLIDSLLSSGHEVSIIAPYDKYYSILESRGYHLIKSDIGTSKGVFSKILGILKTTKFLFKSNPDWVFSFTIYPNFLFSLLSYCFRFKLVSNITGLGSFALNNKKSILKSLIYRQIFKGSYYVFFQNKHDLHYFQQKKFLGNTNHSVIPGSGVDLSTSGMNYDENSELIFAFVGRLIIDKGVVEFFDAISYLRDLGHEFKVRVFGGFSKSNPGALSKDYIESVCNTLDIEFKGYVEAREDIYEGLSAIILPSYREGTAKVLLEACAHSIPCLTTDVPGCNNVIRDGFNGFLCKPKDYRSLANIILKFASLSPSRKKKFSKNARLQVEENFSEEIVISRYSKLLKS